MSKKSSQNLRILGIDPGTAIVGFGLIESDGTNYHAIDFGCITTSSKLNHIERIGIIINDLNEIIEEYQPQEIAIEELFFSKNVKTALKVAEARGAMLYKFQEKGLPIYEYKPNQIKLNLCGYGAAPKLQIQTMVKILLNLKSIPQPDDAADALAIAICHANHLKTNLLFKQND